MSGRPEIEIAPDGLIDEPFAPRLRGGGDGEVLWRARIRDDDGRVWTSVAEDPARLYARWSPKRSGTGDVAALRSLRPIAVDVLAELEDGRNVTRTITRRLQAEGVRARRWREPVAGTLLRPEGDGPFPTAVVDELLAAALLASRGVLVFAAAAVDVGAATELLATIPAAGAEEPLVLVDAAVPPGVPARTPGDASAWDALLERAGASGRGA